MALYSSISTINGSGSFPNVVNLISSMNMDANYIMFTKTEEFYWIIGQNLSYSLTQQACGTGSNAMLSYLLVAFSSVVGIEPSGVVSCSPTEEGTETYEYIVVAPTGEKLANSKLKIIAENWSDIEYWGKCSVNGKGDLTWIECKYSDYKLDSASNSCSQENITDFAQNSIVAVQGVIGVSERVDNKLGSTCSHHCAVNGREWSQHSGSVENSQPFPEPNAANLKPSCDPA